MEMQQFTFSKAKTLKCIIIYFLLFLAGDLLSSVPFDLLFSVVKLPAVALYSIIRMISCLLFTYFLFWFYTTKILHLHMKDFGITFAVKKWGILFAVCLPVFVVSIFLMIGDASANKFTFIEIILIIIASSARALKAGILEEMLFRGYIMKLLEKRWNRRTAVLLPSFLFGLLHIPSMGTYSLAGVLCLIVSGTMVGVMFSVVAYKGNSISNSALLHAVWNFVMITDILHITTLQEAYGEPVFSIIIPSGNVLLTGGEFGIEASVIAIIGYLFICVASLWLKGKENDKSMGRDFIN